MKSSIFKAIIIKPGSILNIRYLLAQEHSPFDCSDRMKEASMRPDLQAIIHTPSNFAVVMGVYPQDAQSQSFRFHLN